MGSFCLFNLVWMCSSTGWTFISQSYCSNWSLKALDGFSELGLLPLHPQVIFISEISVFCFFPSTSVFTYDIWKHRRRDRGDVLGLTGSPVRRLFFQHGFWNERTTYSGLWHKKGLAVHLTNIKVGIIPQRFLFLFPLLTLSCPHCAVLSFHTCWTSRERVCVCMSVCVIEGKTGFQTKKNLCVWAKLGLTWSCHCIEINSLSCSLYLCSVFWLGKILIKRFTTCFYLFILLTNQQI